jgi:transcriptional regulator with XRE-family HTH domain
MKSLGNHLQEELQNSDFKKAFDEELRLAKLAVQIAKNRERRGLTQAQLASRAHISQQQVSKVEHAGASGFNVNTLLRVCEALGLDLTLSPRESGAPNIIRRRYASSLAKGSAKKASEKKVASSLLQSGKTTAKRSAFAR